MFVTSDVAAIRTINNIIDPGQNGTHDHDEMTRNPTKGETQVPSLIRYSICSLASMKIIHRFKGLDNENDSVHKELCAPYIGGGPRAHNTAGDRMPGGIGPNPSLPPPRNYIANHSILQPHTFSFCSPIT